MKHTFISMMYVNVFPLDPLSSQMEDSPSKKTSEIKPTGNGDAKVFNDTVDNSLQGRRVKPDCDDMVRIFIIFMVSLDDPVNEEIPNST